MLSKAATGVKEQLKHCCGYFGKKAKNQRFSDNWLKSPIF